MHLDAADVASVPSFRFILSTRTNGLNKFRIQRPHRLYDYRLAGEKFREKYGNNPKLQTSDEALKNRIEFLQRDIAIDKQDANREAIRALDTSYEGVRLHMCVVFAPWVEDASSQTEKGMFCSICLGGYVQDQLYTRQSMIEHLKKCRVGPFHPYMGRDRN
ncbi:hypothetical protein G6011_02571 [Alternaria panax]|uniref:Uncharacterized protein n=1 Tax=Alternaria panax TaxID=48097 RepID=A0AAD4I1Y5_9PLEO|nr:hypothetical protein G6011_02571 [Alternaria panax]